MIGLSQLCCIVLISVSVNNPGCPETPIKTVGLANVITSINEADSPLYCQLLKSAFFCDKFCWKSKIEEDKKKKEEQRVKEEEKKKKSAAQRRKQLINDRKKREQDQQKKIDEALNRQREQNQP